MQEKRNDSELQLMVTGARRIASGATCGDLRAYEDVLRHMRPFSDSLQHSDSNLWQTKILLSYTGVMSNSGGGYLTRTVRYDNFGEGALCQPGLETLRGGSYLPATEITRLGK